MSDVKSRKGRAGPPSNETAADGQPSGGGMRSLARLVPFARPYGWHFAVVVLLVVVFNASSVLQPFLVKIAIDRDLSAAHPHPHALFTISLLYVGVALIGVAANIGQMILLQFAGQNVVKAIRMRLFSHIERQGMAFFDGNAIGRLVTNVSSDTETVSQFFTQFFLSLIRDGLSILMIIVAMFELDAAIARECMVVLPVIFAVSLVFRNRLRSAYQTTRTRLSTVVAFLAENLSGMRIIQIFHQEPRQADRFETLNHAYKTANVREYGTSVLFNRSLDLLGNLSVAAVVWFGGQAVLHHALLFGTLYAFISYIRQFFSPINSITQQWNTLQSSVIAAERIGRVMAVEPSVVDPPQPETLANPLGDVAFCHVTFAYKPGEPVLNDIDFTVGAGEFVGFVGATGAGKSSIMSLLTRLYDPQGGTILLDGVDIRQLTQAELHRHVGIVQQDLQLFTGTVADNIRLFRPEISDEQVRFAAEVAGVHDIVRRFPQGYDTRLYAKGANLSMGQRQLIAFARVVALDPRVLILDEATASLDSQTEAMLQESLRRVAKRRTTLVIAHRLSTVRQADMIVVLDKGGIVERGTHASLLEQRGWYANLYHGAQEEAAAKKPGRGQGVFSQSASAGAAARGACSQKETARRTPQVEGTRPGAAVARGEASAGVRT